MFETMSIPFLTNVITPLSIIFCLLCGLTTIVIFLYWQERCEKGSDISNVLLLVVSSCHLTSSVMSTLIFVSIFTQATEGTIFPCFVFVIAQFCDKVQLISTLLLSVIITWRNLWPDQYASIRQCALKRISGLVSVVLFIYQIFVDMMTCDKEAFCPREVMENLLVPEVFFSIQKLLNQMECRMLIGSIFIAASIVAVALTTFCLIFKSLCQFVSAKRNYSDQESTGLAEATQNENQDTLSVEASSIATSAPETERVAEKTEVERQTTYLERKESSSRRFVPVMYGREPDMGDEDCEPREGASRRDCGVVRVRDVSRRCPERESVRGRGRVRDIHSLPAFKNTRRLKLSTLVLILYSAFLNFVSQPVVLWFSGNIILVKSISLLITTISPLFFIRMENDILSFVREVLNKGD